MFKTSIVPSSPPRCSPAWSDVQDQRPSRPTPSLLRPHAARQRGAMFKTTLPPEPIPSLPPRCSPAWSDVQDQSVNQPRTHPFFAPRCSPAWSDVQDQRVPARTHPFFAPTLLASVERCSRPAPPARTPSLLRPHAARQRGAMFKTSTSRPNPSLLAPTLLASVERCSRPAPPPRTHPFFATTLLASVERCSRPDRKPQETCQDDPPLLPCRPVRMMRLRPCALCSQTQAHVQPAAALHARQLPIFLPVAVGLDGLLASSGTGRRLVSRTGRSHGAGWDSPAQAPLVLNMAPRWRAAWWPKRSRGGTRSGSEHGSTLASSVVAEEVAWRDAVWC